MDRVRGIAEGFGTVGDLHGIHGPAVSGATALRNSYDAKTTLVEWDGTHLAMDAVASDGVSEARLVDPESSRYLVMDRRSDAVLVSSEAGFCLMRVPRGNRELLLVTPEGRWMPLLSPSPVPIPKTATFCRWG